MRMSTFVFGLLVLSGCAGGLHETTGGGEGGGTSTDGTGAGATGDTGTGNTGTGGAGSTGTDTPAGGGGPSMAVDCTHVGSGKDYQVGEGKEYANIGDVPLETLAAGDTVRVFWRAAPYREKVMIGGSGTKDQPIRFCGVPGPSGELPVIDAEDATTRPQLDFPYDGHQARGLVIIGHPHDDFDYYRQPEYITIEGFEIKNAGPPFTFTDRHGQVTPYSKIAAGIFVERGDHITIRGCDIHDNYNGLFMGTGGDEKTVCKDALVEANDIYDNGSPTEWYEHNVYNEVKGIVYQFNYFGPTRNLRGNGIKERSAGVIIRYNWIEDGAHLLDIVDSQEANFVNVADPAFHETFVYGNVLVRGSVNAGSIVHYGGDSGLFENYRKGTLHFYDNTVVVDNTALDDYETTSMFEASTNEESLDIRNNVFFSVSRPTDLRGIVFLGARDGVASGILTLANNWVSTGWTVFDPTPGKSLVKAGEAAGLDTCLFGDNPGFTSLAEGNYGPAAGAAVVGAGTALGDLPVVEFEYDVKQGVGPRNDGASPTIGAFGP